MEKEKKPYIPKRLTEVPAYTSYSPKEPPLPLTAEERSKIDAAIDRFEEERRAWREKYGGD